jgi:hypothetical protein
MDWRSPVASTRIPFAACPKGLSSQPEVTKFKAAIGLRDDGQFSSPVTLASRETQPAGERLQVSCVSEKRRGQNQLTLFWTLPIG